MKELNSEACCIDAVFEEDVGLTLLNPGFVVVLLEGDHLPGVFRKLIFPKESFFINMKEALSCHIGAFCCNMVLFFLRHGSQTLLKTWRRRTTCMLTRLLSMSGTWEFWICWLRIESCSLFSKIAPWIRRRPMHRHISRRIPLLYSWDEGDSMLMVAKVDFSVTSPIQSSAVHNFIFYISMIITQPDLCELYHK